MSQNVLDQLHLFSENVSFFKYCRKLRQIVLHPPSYLCEIFKY